ncbi:hypothetical protein AB0P45_05830 [Streptomyces niveus]|uniref:hypothetical protein n=1 Tax=Streptomyces niveus TaxID=193462 RepID=UPI003431DA72
MKKVTAVLFAASVLASVGLQGMATAAPTGATAWPTGCSNQRYNEGWTATCSNSNGGSYKATVTCAPYNGGPDVVRDNPNWIKSGRSIVFCPPATTVQFGGIWTRSY